VILNDQIQAAEVRAENEVIVQEATHGLAAATVAGGNTVHIATERQNLSFGSAQDLHAPVVADAYVQTRYTSGPAFVNSVQANGNSGDASTCCGYLAADVRQTIGGHSPVIARNRSAVGGPVEHVATSASAVGNSQGYSAVGGTIGARTVQKHYGSTGAYNQNVFCCITGSGSFSATAVANNVNSAGNYGAAYHEIEQLVDGYKTVAENEVYAVTGNDILGVATATANNIHAYNTQGPSELIARQTNISGVEADSHVRLDTWYNTGASVAYGVGNSISQTTEGGSPYMDTTQVNAGDITTRASFTGGTSEGDSLVTATAIGNTVGGVSCGACYGGIQASNTQVNTGAVRASARTSIGGHAHTVTSVATAVGNSASYEVRSGN
jgi:hypothetical protein